MRSLFPAPLLAPGKHLFLRRLIGWQQGSPGLAMRAIVAAVGIGTPLAVAFLIGRFPLGLGIALGCFSIQPSLHAKSFGEAWREVPELVLPAVLAAAAGLIATALPSAANWVFLVCALFSSLSMRYSRPVAVAATRFMIYLFMFGNALILSPIPVGLFALICLGIGWMTLVALIVSRFGAGAAEKDTGASLSVASRLRRMRREFNSLSTWDYPARLTLGVALSLSLKIRYPEHHYYWASLTVLLCTPRQFEAWPIRAAQRALGTLIGVVAAQVLILAAPKSATVLVALIVLSFARRWFDERSYLLYSAVMAPLILFLMGPEKMLASSAAPDRVLATLAGALIVLVANLCAARTTARALPHPDLKQQLKATD